MYGRTHRIHFIGVGGSGMSGIAEVLLTMGYQVSGSDLKTGEVTERAIFQAGGQQLRAIANAENVKVSVLGRNGMVQRTFKPENFEKFREFVQRYVTTG